MKFSVMIIVHRAVSFTTFSAKIANGGSRVLNFAENISTRQYSQYLALNRKIFKGISGLIMVFF